MIRNFLEVVERSYTGEQIGKDEWDFDYVVMKTMELVEKYDLHWDKNVIIPEDENLLNRLFKAGKELIETIGIYNLSTQRRILFTKEEIEEALYHIPQELVMGEGKDARTLYARKIEDTRRPLVWAGNPGVPTPEYLFKATVRGWAQEPVVDLITCGSLIDVDGFSVRSREATELTAVRRELQYMHQVLKQVGRPGMGMLGAESSVSEVGNLSAANPEYLRTCDSQLVAMFNELMVDRDNLVRAANSVEYNVKNASLACVMVGGLGGDAPGAALLEVASFLAANIICRASYHLCHPIHINYVATSARGCMWLQSAVCQAFALNAPSIIVGDIYPKSGALTKELLYEVAANAIAISVSGGHLEGVGAADGSAPNGTGLEARLMGEVGHAVTNQRLSRSKANEIVLKLLEKYEHVFTMEGGNPGKKFDEAYDMKTVQPVPEWLQMYYEVKDELKEMGLYI